MVEKNKPIEPTLKKMEISDTEEFSIEKMKSVRSVVSMVSIVSDKKFKTRQLNDKRLIEVTRIS